jgi:non-canonical purine NTP pyrophosphatase (RdgB/HAM1 family)
LVFNALGGLPGPLIKWFYKVLGNDGLCKLLDNYENKNIIAEVAFAFCDEGGVKVFSGKMEGKISRKPKGSGGFGWDPIFIPKGCKKTWAEMTKKEKHDTSMRKIALWKMKEYFDSLK